MLRGRGGGRRKVMAAERMWRLQCRIWQRLLGRYRMTWAHKSDDASVAQTRGSAADAQALDVTTSLGSSGKTKKKRHILQCDGRKTKKGKREGQSIAVPLKPSHTNVITYPRNRIGSSN
jgi:hypothetical protein